GQQSCRGPLELPDTPGSRPLPYLLVVVEDDGSRTRGSVMTDDTSAERLDDTFDDETNPYRASELARNIFTLPDVPSGVVLACGTAVAALAFAERCLDGGGLLASATLYDAALLPGIMLFVDRHVMKVMMVVGDSPDKLSGVSRRASTR
ncbi:hypothetical protein FOZ63_034017, partial [Perkinsus olseni]